MEFDDTEQTLSKQIDAVDEQFVIEENWNSLCEHERKEFPYGLPPGSDTDEEQSLSTKKKAKNKTFLEFLTCIPFIFSLVSV